MLKIPSLFERDWDGDKGRVLPVFALDLPSDAVATRKWDGTAVRVHQGELWKRYNLKANRSAPEGFEPCGPRDERTGHQFGWVPVGDGPEDRWLREATKVGVPTDGTYELCGPKIGGNPEAWAAHVLIPHGVDILNDVPTDFDGLRKWLGEHLIEGIVWWSAESDGPPLAKIKRRDFGLPWPPRKESNRG